jgi:uncharacterized protein
MPYYPLLLEMKKLLGSLNACLDKATVHATEKNYDPKILLQSRLAPDMFPLLVQIQATCDQAKYAAGRTTGKEMPVHPDGEQSLEELKQRIREVVAYLDSFGPGDFDGINSRLVTTPRWKDKSMTAPNYFVEHALPNFFFHLSMAYAILRHNGVDVGKRDYLGAITYC